MAGVLRRVLKLLMLLIPAISLRADAALLDLEEGKVCKQVDGVDWTCTPLQDCPTANAATKKKIMPDICNKKDDKMIVCCQPSKSKRMCVKYSKNVIVEEVDPYDGSKRQRDTCAAVEPLIVGGVNAVPREFPHMALVGTEDSGGEKQWVCGGSLVSTRFVLSAAHCTRSGKDRQTVVKWVRLGEYEINSTRDDRKGYATPRDFKIVDIFDHPDYKSDMVYNDISLYKLEKEVEITEFIRPVCLQTDDEINNKYTIATGWGKLQAYSSKAATILQKVNLTVSGWQNCSDTYPSEPRLPQGVRNETQLCAASFNSVQIKDTCNGDSGGPLQVRLKTPYCMYNQVGITSFGQLCGFAFPRPPGVYTRVSYYVPWIESVVWPDDD